MTADTAGMPVMLGRMLTVYLAYLVAGKLGLLIPYVGSHIALIWLPTGIAIAAILRWGFISVIPIYLASFTVNFLTGAPLLLSVQMSIGNPIGPMVAATLLQHFDFKSALDRMRDILLLLVSVSTGMLITASCGVLALVMGGAIGKGEVLQAWLIWWLGDSVGALLILPLLLNLGRKEATVFWRYRLKILFGFVIFSVFDWYAFDFLKAQTGQLMWLSFLLLPLVIWAAMRYGISGASVVILGVSLSEVWAMANQRGLFFHADMHQSIFSLWIFMATMMIVAMMVVVLQARHKLSETALRDSESKLRGMINGALDAIVTIDEQGCIIEFNPAAEHIFGYKRDSVLGRNLAEVIIPPDMRKMHMEGHERFVKTGNQNMFGRRMELMAMRADGTEFPVELTITSLSDQGLPYVTGFIRDITEKKRAEQDIRNLAFFDALTGLPNRRLLMDRLQQALASSSRTQKYGVVMFIDLDNFKIINDSRGHDYGDLLLIEVARRLRSCVRLEDTVSRLSGDEFVLILEDLSLDVDQSVIEARTVGEKILTAIYQSYRLKDVEYHNSCSIGISLFCGNQISVEELLKRADTAMYQAKASGRNTLQFHDPQMQEALERRMELESQLRVALLNQQFFLLYQPQVDAARKVFCAEVLLRWNHPGRGWLSPTEFIATAEESGLIVAIGHWVLFHACLQLKAWESAEHSKDIQLAVNVSARQFRQPNFVEEIRQMLVQTGANPELLKLELTESIVLDNMAEAILKMQELRGIGVRFAMDDFGTGYSSLAYLKQLPLSQIKIDQSFVRDIATDPNDAAIVQTIIAMSSTLGLNVIAEGVETEAQFDMLQQYGCRQFQGFLFGRPMVLAELESMLDQDGLLFSDEYSENNDLR
ncbi:MAG: sensor domain-containing diguanylate cyclase [Betaproteobacteria bacterium HGW-Betaproteobacteria-1]|nr:MAG: sensor domain-containing diguanylate cyclase [Betaproteobacteria bacterium HGW-Betaproteobacteria-1]